MFLRIDICCGTHDEFYIIPTISISKFNNYLEFTIHIFNYYIDIIISFERYE